MQEKLVSSVKEEMQVHHLSALKRKKCKLNSDDKSDSDSENSMSALNVSDSDYDPLLAADPLLTEM